MADPVDEMNKINESLQDTKPPQGTEKLSFEFNMPGGQQEYSIDDGDGRAKVIVTPNNENLNIGITAERRRNSNSSTMWVEVECGDNRSNDVIKRLQLRYNNDDRAQQGLQLSQGELAHCLYDNKLKIHIHLL